jgi:probable rRNA maturation factor
MIIHITNSQKNLRFSLASLKKMIPFLLNNLNIHTDELSLHFVSKKKMGIVHEEFFSDPSPTDCMSFPIDPPSESRDFHHVLGEIFVCPQVAVEYALENDLDPYKELTLYIIHGILHLIGYDDIQEVDRKKMRVMEEHCLSILAPFSLHPPLKKACLK